MWFDRENPDVEFCDIREMDDEVIWTSKDGTQERRFSVHPDTVADVRNLPFPDESFYHIVFDPPHLTSIGEQAWICKKYGTLYGDWTDWMEEAFDELFRVLKPYGTLIFKWAEVDIKLSQILEAIPYKPLYGHRSGKHMTTIWCAFMKIPKGEENESQT